MKVTLVTFSPKGARKEFALGERPMIVGRGPEADIRIQVSEVSRSHCQFTMNGTKAVIKDLGSSNGTYVNDQKVAQATLKAGDLVRTGPVVFTVQIDGLPKDIKPVSASKAPPSSAVTSKSAQSPTAPVSKSAPAEPPTRIGPPSKAPSKADDESDLSDLDAIDVDDLSDLDLDEIKDLEDSDLMEDSDDLEELSEDDLVDDDDDTATGKK